ncbi:hypothetical protein Tco_1513951, partial [Tanacetum coccineum]
MILDRFTQHTVDPLALMSNVLHQQYYSQSSTTPPSTYVPPHFADNTQLDSGLSPTDKLIENLTNTLSLLTQSYKTFLPQTNNQLRTSSNTKNQATVQDGRVVEILFQRVIIVHFVNTFQDSMADLNIPADIAPAEQAPAVAPATRTDDQILLSSKWVPIGKSNSVLDAFIASSTIPAIYIQQFWDTMCFNSSTRLYSCQLDEQWFNLHKDILRDALGITPANDNNPFEAPPSSDTILWGITHHSNIDYAERIWEEFVQSIQIFLIDKKNLATKARRKKKTLHLLIPNVRTR